MTRVFLFFFLVKAVMLALGILAWYGQHWAFGLFLIVSIVAAFTDLLMALVANSADKDIDKNLDVDR